MEKELKFLIAIDRTEMADIILKRAIKLIPENAEVMLVNILDTASNFGQGAVEIERVIKKDEIEAKEFIDKILCKFPLKNKYKKLEVKIIDGNPSQKLAFDLIKEKEIDYLIIGATTHTSLMDKLFVGSTAKRIIDETPCNVILIKR